MLARSWRAILLAVLGLAVVVGDLYRPTGMFSISNVSFDSRSNAPLTIQAPVSLPISFHIRFDAVAHHDYATLFESFGATGSSMRISAEGQHLYLTLFRMNPEAITLVDGFQLNRWHSVSVDSEPLGGLTVAVDGQRTVVSMRERHQAQSSAELGEKDFAYHFDTLTMGTKGDGQVQIRKFDMTATYYRNWPIALVAALDAGIVVLACWLAAPWLRVRSSIVLPVSDAYSALLTAAGVVVGFALDAHAIGPGKWSIVLGMACGALVASATAKFIPRTMMPRGVSILMLALVAAVVVIALQDLPNVVVLERMCARWQLSTPFFCIMCLLFAVRVLQEVRNRPALSAPSRFAWVPYAIFAVLAFRADPLFAPINALHWAYFVGPVQGLHTGGWLLWDVPSQYGFLNVFLASLMPAAHAVDAVFRFQALTLFFASALFYWTLAAILGLNRVLACAVVVVFFFFADPLLIGPAPYPSMSTVRFLWCYVLLAVAAREFLGTRPSLTRFTRVALPSLLAGVLWSAESAVYAFVIYFVPVFADVALIRRPSSVRLFIARSISLLWPSIAGLAITVSVIGLVYIVGLGHLPDIQMFAMYARSYGGGFGELPVPIAGPVWLVGLTVGASAGAFAGKTTGTRGPALLAATAGAVVWISTSYYFGRAFPVVITTLLPLIVFSLLCIVRAASFEGRALFQGAVALPVLTLILASIAWNANIPLMMDGFVSPSLSVADRWPQAPPWLAADLQRTAVTPATRIAYESNWVGMPRQDGKLFDQIWLPMPLEALEVPVPRAVRDVIVDRFVARHGLAGLYIEDLRPGNNLAEQSAWLRRIGRNFIVTRVLTGRPARFDPYLIYRATLKT